MVCVSVSFDVPGRTGPSEGLWTRGGESVKCREALSGPGDPPPHRLEVPWAVRLRKMLGLAAMPSLIANEILPLHVAKIPLLIDCCQLLQAVPLQTQSVSRRCGMSYGSN